MVNILQTFFLIQKDKYKNVNNCDLIYNNTYYLFWSFSASVISTLNMSHLDPIVPPFWVVWTGTVAYRKPLRPTMGMSYGLDEQDSSFYYPFAARIIFRYYKNILKTRKANNDPNNKILAIQVPNVYGIANTGNKVFKHHNVKKGPKIIIEIIKAMKTKNPNNDGSCLFFPNISILLVRFLVSFYNYTFFLTKFNFLIMFFDWFVCFCS